MTEHHRPPLGALAAAALASMATAVQARINGTFGDRLDDGVLAAFLATSVGLVVLVVLVSANPSTRSGWAALRPALASGRLRWWELLGGIGGAVFVVGQSVTVATIGVALFTVCTVAGQTVGGAGVDRAGLAPGGVRPTTWPRVAAAILCVVAVSLAVSGQGSGTAQPALVTLALVAGLLAAFQGAFNGQVAAVTRSPTVSTLMNFLVAWVFLIVVVAVQHAVSREPLATPPAPWDEPWLWSGGLIGIGFVIVMSATIRSLGVLVFGLASVAGAMVGAVLVDLVSPDAPPLTARLLVGVALTFAAVALAGVRPRGRVRPASAVRQDGVT